MAMVCFLIHAYFSKTLALLIVGEGVPAKWCLKNVWREKLNRFLLKLQLEDCRKKEQNAHSPATLSINGLTKKSQKWNCWKLHEEHV